jgi:DNA-binding LytR/AlgR family response regulator
MDPYKITLIDDEKKALDFLEAIIEGIPGFEVNFSSTSPFEGLEFAIDSKSDLVITDIIMPQVNGFWLAQRLKSNNIPVIITSAQWSQSWMAFDVDAIDFLGKPLEFLRVSTSLEKFKKAFSEKKNEPIPFSSIMIKHHATNSLIPIDRELIIYAKAGKDYAELYHLDKFNKENIKKDLGRITVANLLMKLTHPEFMQIHKSYIINCNMLSRYEYHQVHLHGNICVPIGASFRKSLYRKFSGDIIL